MSVLREYFASPGRDPVGDGYVAGAAFFRGWGEYFIFWDGGGYGVRIGGGWFFWIRREGWGWRWRSYGFVGGGIGEGEMEYVYDVVGWGGYVFYASLADVLVTVLVYTRRID